MAEEEAPEEEAASESASGSESIFDTIKKFEQELKEKEEMISKKEAELSEQESTLRTQKEEIDSARASLDSDKENIETAKAELGTEKERVEALSAEVSQKTACIGWNSPFRQTKEIMVVVVRQVGKTCVDGNVIYPIHQIIPRIFSFYRFLFGCPILRRSGSLPSGMLPVFCIFIR